MLTTSTQASGSFFELFQIVAAVNDTRVHEAFKPETFTLRIVVCRHIRALLAFFTTGQRRSV